MGFCFHQKTHTHPPNQDPSPMRTTLILLALLALAGCGMKPNFPKAPPGSPPGRTYPDPATDPKPAQSQTNSSKPTETQPQ